MRAWLNKVMPQPPTVAMAEVVPHSSVGPNKARHKFERNNGTSAATEYHDRICSLCNRTSHIRNHLDHAVRLSSDTDRKWLT